MADKQTSKLMARINGVIGLFIGIFGALAILGVLVKILKMPEFAGFTNEQLIVIGFGGEIVVFLIMGILQLVDGFMAKGTPRAVAGEGAGGVAGGAYYTLESKELVQDLHAAVKERVTAEVTRIMADFGVGMQQVNKDLHSSILNAVQPKITNEIGQLTSGLGQVMTALGEDVKRFGGEMRQMSAEMQHARAAVHGMREQLNKAATGSLPADAEKLGAGMRQLSDEMAAAGNEAHAIRHELATVSLRFKQFNNPVHVNGQGAHADATPAGR